MSKRLRGFKMNKKEITNFINDVYEAVEDSKIGKIEYFDEKGQKMVSQVAYQVFTIVLSSLCPKGPLTGEMTMKEPKDDWEK